MNKWVQKSANLAKGKYYLDKLLEIYPPDEISREKILKEESLFLEYLFKEKKCVNLIKELIRLKKQGFKFPIENPYISFLTYYEDAIYKNPMTVKKICDKLFEMSYNELKLRLESPKKASRRIGPMFKIWLKHKFNFYEIDEFKKATGIAFLNGSDKFLKKYAESQLKCKFKELSKGLDFIAKVESKYIIGTAKFITDFGGSQDNQFKEAIIFIKETDSPSNVIKVAVIDGVAWLDGRMKQILEKLKSTEFCFSVLLLEEFIKEQLSTFK